jgi:SMC interacting uncharacterized protein involved in chromosome segregation
MENGNGQFKDKTVEWRGYTLRALEDISKELNEVKEELKSCNTKIDGLNNKITGIQIKVAAIGGTSGIIASVILFLLTKV